MALTEIDSGTEDVTLDTPVTLFTVTDPGSYTLTVDLNEMQNGDVVRIRILEKVLNGSTARVVYQASYAHVQANPIVKSTPVDAFHEISATLEQTDGTARDFDWSLRQLDG